MRNSIRQLLRMKTKTVLFFGLISLCALLVCLGSNLVIQCRKNLEQYMNTFITLGTVEQKPEYYSSEAVYSAETKDYTYYNCKHYGKVFSLSDLPTEEDGIQYISGPERRPFYKTYLPQYDITKGNMYLSNEIVVEASPLEDCIPDGPKKMIYSKILASVYQLTVDDFDFCDHHNPNPEMMYADKTYVMNVDQGVPHGWDRLTLPKIEYIPISGPYSEQTTADGTPIPNDLPNLAVEEVNDEYYAKGHDKYWQAYATEKEMQYHSFPVTATNDLNLMMPFYDQNVAIVEGRALTEEDFTQGTKTCMISYNFAMNNSIQVDDVLTLPLRCADYSSTPAVDWGNCSLTAKGEIFKSFFKADYQVVGIYRMLPAGGTDDRYNLEENEIIIPRKSITVDDGNDISCYGNHVSQFNTSFRIPNGTIDEFMEKWNEKGIKNVDIHFYDRGYSKLEAGLKQMELMAILLLGAGVLMTILVLIFFSNMMISGQKRRTAIERSLGSSKRECMCSLLTGILLVAAVGCIIGCLSGFFLTGAVADKMGSPQIFNRLFSNGAINSEVQTEQAMSGESMVTTVSFLFLFSFTTLISGTTAWRNLKEEPLALLSGDAKR